MTLAFATIAAVMCEWKASPTAIGRGWGPRRGGAAAPGPGLARDGQDPAELGVGVAELRDGRLAGERPERRERRRHRRERVGLVHHHRDHGLGTRPGPLALS